MSKLGIVSELAASESCLAENSNLPQRQSSSEAHFDGSGAPHEVSENRIVIIDRRVLVGRCLMTSLQAINDDCQFEMFPDARSWRESSAFSPTSVVLFCRSGGDQPNAELAQIAADLKVLECEGRVPPVVVMAESDDAEHIVRVLKAGAKGYIPTTVSPNVALQALQLVRVGGFFIPPEVLMSVPSTNKAQSHVEDRNDDMFSPRQLSVARALRKGTPNKIIAYELNMCESTVKVHVRNIMRKLKAKNRTEVAYLTNEYFRQDEAC